MKLKQRLASLLAAALLLGLGPAALAEAGGGCTIEAAAVSAGPGETVEVTVSLTGNPGFTNLAVALDYDREKLTLTALQPPEQEGLLTAVNTAWSPAAGGSLDSSKSYGYVTMASAAALEEDSALFTASFTVKEGVSGEAAVTPVVCYMRDNTALFSVFEARNATGIAGKVSIAAASGTVRGDINGDGQVSAVDAAFAYAAFNGKRSLTAQQQSAADVNGDGSVTATDAAMIYAYFNGKLAQFPAG